MAVLADFRHAVQLLLSFGASCTMTDQNGCSPLHIASQMQNPFLASTLLQNDCDIDGLNRDGFSPLHQAIQFGSDTQLVQQLVAEEANVAVQAAKSGETPMHEVCREFPARNGLAKALLAGRNGYTSLEMQDACGDTPLDHFMSNVDDVITDHETLLELIEAGAQGQCKA